MRIDELIEKKQTISFEVFPPKPEADADLEGIRRTLRDLRGANPDFVSVTYGAGGNNRPRAIDIADMVISLGMVPLSHLTAIGYAKEEVAGVVAALTDTGVENILALRGDKPTDAGRGADCWKDFRKASELAGFVSQCGDFCIGGAAYPEGHQESSSPEADIEFMKEKLKKGVSFFITQLFFDNPSFTRFADRCRAAGVKAPIIAGIMPVLKARQIRRIVEISGCNVPEALGSLLDRYIDDDRSMREAGIEYAAEQISYLWSRGVSGIHIYTMNKSEEVLEILRRCNLRRGDDAI
ncbi:MAG: methylenetetrahydrofolate reductase [Synergistaceae bacterium]|jgi:methylenetetrahydrofolate reductase (NADPH)|nr:methylenetetrahydrofolate reductase [Synergistaceae bacterium]